MFDDKTVLVTGGSGFVGSALQRMNPSWIYLSSSDCDLMDYASTLKCFKHYAPSAIIHLAARVGGIKENALRQAEFFDQNILINTNVVRAAYNAGVYRLLASLSTCAFPDTLQTYPFNENDFYSGPPASTNFSYGYSKRVLHAQCCAYRKQYEVNYSTFCPSNLYGPGDNFDPNSSHFIAALIRKVVTHDGGDIEMWGTGNPLRQHLYVDDLAALIPELLELHNGDAPLIVAPNENLSIVAACKIFAKSIHKNINFKFNNELDGQFRKDGSNSLLTKVLGKKTGFTPFEIGVKETYEWYKASR